MVYIPCYLTSWESWLHRAPRPLPPAKLCRDTAAPTASPGGPEAAGSGFVRGCQTKDRVSFQLRSQTPSLSLFQDTTQAS